MMSKSASTTIHSTVVIESPTNLGSNSLSTTAGFLPRLTISLMVMIDLILISICCNAKKGKNYYNVEFWKERPKRKNQYYKQRV